MKNFTRTFTFKLLGLAFCGTHIPLLCLLGWYVGPGRDAQPAEILLVALGATLMATGITLWLIHRQIKPVLDASSAISQILPGRDVPVMPVSASLELQAMFDSITQAFSKAKELMEEKQYLMTMLSHDLCSPATGVLGALQVLEMDTPLEPELRARIFKQLKCSANYQLDLVSTVMSLMRADMEEGSVLQTYRLCDLLAPTLERVQVLASLKHVSLEAEIPDFKMQLSPLLFRQAVENLLTNAVKFSYPGQCVRIRVIANSESIRLEVQDQGMGFEAGMQEYLLANAIKSGRQGTAGEKSNGIGLFLVRRAVERHHGSMTVHSPGLGKGATFAIQLPMAA